MIFCIYMFLYELMTIISFQTNHSWHQTYPMNTNNSGLQISNIFSMNNPQLNNSATHPPPNVYNDSDSDVMFVENEEDNAVIILDENSADKNEFIDIMSLSRYEE